MTPEKILTLFVIALLSAATVSGHRMIARGDNRTSSHLLTALAAVLLGMFIQLARGLF
jgi:hypothetical protein